MRSRTLFLLAILMGLITTIIFILNMKSGQPEVEMIEMAEVVVAITAIQVNQVIAERMVELREIPKEQKHEATIQKIEDVVGKIAAARIEADEVFLLHRIQSVEEELVRLSRKIKEGYRGVSIGLNIVQSVSNLVQPGDEVDVIFTKIEKEDDEEIVSTNMILSKIRVVAIGQRITLSKEAEETVQFAEVTLEVLPEDMMTLANAHETGNIHLALYSSIINN